MTFLRWATVYSLGCRLTSSYNLVQTVSSHASRALYSFASLLANWNFRTVGLERAASPTASCTSPVFGKVCIPLKWFLSYALCNFLRSYRSSRTASRSAWLRPPHRSLLCVHRRKRIENASPVHLFCSIRSLRSALPLAVAIALCGRLQVSLWLCYGSPRMLGTPSGQQARRA